MDLSQGERGEIIPLDVPQRLGLRFNNIWLLQRALTHRSYVNEHPEIYEDNERLEFLGDAVLDFLVGAWLYNHFPEMSEGQLTRLRASLVGNEQLAAFAQQIKLGDFMLLGKGEEEGGGRQRPALLGCTFEALVGALFLDQGLQSVQEFIEPILEREISKYHQWKLRTRCKELASGMVPISGVGRANLPYYCFLWTRSR